MKLQKLLPSVVFAASATAITANAQQISNPILYVTQVPPSQGHNTVLSIDGNLLATTAAAPRGGDLMILYPDLSVKNLTRLAGYGIAGSQQKGPDAIAVRDPHVHFSGTKAVFSMVRGAPSNIGETGEYFWQIYEITGLGKAQTPVITKVPGQHADYNNVQPAYLSDGRIVYATDCPVTGQKHLYPALDEDGLGPAGTGLWAVDPEAPQGTQPVMLTHATSGAAEPFVDSFGRVMFTRWDVLQRDKLAATPGRVLLDYQTEAPNATYGQYTEVFPEPLQSQTEPFGLRFDVFMPWTINQDGGNLNTLNHLGRHELSLDFPRSGPDAGLADFTSNEFSPNSVVPAPTRAGAFFQIAEHPYSPGRYVAIDVTMTNLSAGRVVSVLAPPTMNPDLVTVSLISNVGLTRDVSWNAHGQLMGSWMPPVQGVTIPGSYGAPAPPVDPSTQVSGKFSIRLATTNSKLEQGANLTTPQTITTVQIIGGQEVTFNGTPHQLQPTEVSSRTVPVTTATTPEVETPEASVYIRNGVSPTAFQTWL
ncbi:MAG TPA: hypothetical protein VHM91_03670, partial [Verrucomicrobiales bacterium]|nr:hypothetical protein [Verrucomicrobiales bacterium]